MIVDGRAIAEKLFNTVSKQIAELTYTPKLGVVTCAPTRETKQYLELKKRKAQQVGIDLVVLELPNEASTEDCVSSVNRLAEDCHGVLVQLPLPDGINREQVLDAVPVNKDPDGFAYGRDDRSVLPPVAAAIDLIAKENNLSFVDKKVVILGKGRLVGQPAFRYVEKKGGQVTVLTRDSNDYERQIKQAEIFF